MKILSSIIFLFCFSAYSLSAQDLTISVRIGGESAEYAFVYLNENCTGNCDSTGFFVLRSSEYKTGDVLYATMAGIASNHVTIFSGEESVALQLSSNEIVASAIEVDAISRWDEYYKLVRKKFVEFRLSKKYSFDYIIEKYDKSNNLEH